MDAYLALVPLPARISARHALRVSLVLLGEQTPGADTIALALSLLNTSWAQGRMPLASHLKRMRKAVEASRFQTFTSHTPYLTSVADLAEASRAHEAQQTAASWVDSLFNDERELADIWSSAAQRFAARLEVQAEHPDSRATVRKLFECLSPYRDSSDDELDETMAMQARVPYPPRVHLADAPSALGAGGPAALFQALLHGGALTFLARGPGSPAPEPQPQAEPLIEGPKALLWSKDEAAAHLARSQGGPMDGNARQASLLKSMASADGWRKLQQVPEVEGSASALASLYERFPHFGEVLDFVASSIALAGCGTEGTPVRFPPILLRGEPGTGKTFFAQELARVLELHFVERDLSVTTEAFVITGNDASWKGSKPGVVLDTLLHGRTANPLILLNEVDKASERSTVNPPIAAMYALLEPTSAAQFVDEFVAMPINAGYVNWVLTANDGFIPQPVLSRLEVFDIRQPTPEECRAIAASVWRSLLEKSLPAGHGFDLVLPAAVLAKVAAVSPRVMRKVLMRAAGAAVAEGRRSIEAQDLEAGQARYASQRPNAMGFVH